MKENKDIIVPTDKDELSVLYMQYIMEEIESKIIDGITYALVLKSKTERIQRWMEIIQMQKELNINPNHGLTCTKTVNGLIFDMNIVKAKQISIDIMREFSKLNGGKTPVFDGVKEGPEKRRQKDIMEMAKFIKKEAGKGKKNIELAIYSKNSTDRIVLQADKSGKDAKVEYAAFAVRHFDLQQVGNITAQTGVMIRKTSIGEILPSETGVRCNIVL